MADKNPFGDTSPFHVYPIGLVRGSGKKRRIELQEPYRPGLKQLDQFSHVIVL